MGITWVYETIVDRQHERGGEATTPPEPPVYGCEICEQEFSSPALLSEHRATEHPLEPPRLLVFGRPALGEIRVHKALGPDDISVLAASEIHLGGTGDDRQVSESVLKKRLAAGKSGLHRILLRNQRAADGASSEERVDIRIEISRPEELDAVDRAFEAHLGVEDLQERDLERFDNVTRELSSARPYASALYDYCVAVRLGDKEGGDDDDLEIARDKMQRALLTLREFPDRPPARAVSGFIRFALNEFTAWRAAGVPKLDSCAARLIEAAGWESASSASEPAPGERAGTCPANQVTGSLLLAWDKADEAELLELSQRRDLTPEDRSKALVLGILATEKKAATPEMADAARALRHDRFFGQWAESWLDRHPSVAP